ncbi:hypothetical protein V8F06_012534 [Rhypophila decipiens]
MANNGEDQQQASPVPRLQTPISLPPTIANDFELKQAQERALGEFVESLKNQIHMEVARFSTDLENLSSSAGANFTLAMAREELSDHKAIITRGLRDVVQRVKYNVGIVENLDPQPVPPMPVAVRLPLPHTQGANVGYPPTLPHRPLAPAAPGVYNNAPLAAPPLALPQPALPPPSTHLYNAAASYGNRPTQQAVTQQYDPDDALPSTEDDTHSHISEPVETSLEGQARRYAINYLITQTRQATELANPPVHCSEVKDREHIFRCTAITDGHLVIRCPVPGQDGVYHGFGNHPLEYSRAKIHMRENYPCHEGQVGNYSDEDLVLQFGHQVIGNELTKDWVMESNVKASVAARRLVWTPVTGGPGGVIFE